MEQKVTPKLFFSVLLKGIWSFLVFIFGDKHSRAFWRFCVGTVVFLFLAIFILGITVFFEERNRRYSYEDVIGSNYTYHYYYKNYQTSYGYVSDRKGKKVLEDIDWIHANADKTIAVFAKEKRRGYLDLRTGKVIVEPDKYTEAYIFCEGRALVSTKDSLFVIDEKGSQIGKGFAKCKDRKTDINCYHNGYLPMIGDNGKMGLIDEYSDWVIDPEFDYFTFAVGKYWVGRKYQDGFEHSDDPASTTYAAVYDDSLKTILSQPCSYIWVSKETGIILADENHWQRRYDYEGNLVDSFVCERVEHLNYPTGEKQLVTKTEQDYYENERTYTEEVDVMETANLLRYVTSNGWQGLMNAQGEPLTAPLFRNIRAIGKSLYLASYDNVSDFGIMIDDNGISLQ